VLPPGSCLAAGRRLTPPASPVPNLASPDMAAAARASPKKNRRLPRAGQAVAQQARTSREMSPGMSSAVASSDPGKGEAADSEQDQQPGENDAYPPGARSGSVWVLTGAPTGVTGRCGCGRGCGRRCGW